MKLKQISALCLAASTLMATSSAMAWESKDGVWSTSANVALSTDYMWRGYSQTDNEPSISGGFDISHSSGLYVGTWASNVDFGSSTSMEIDYYLGFAGDIADSGVSYDIAALYYDYTDQDGISFLEWNGSLSYSYFTASMAYSSDMFSTGADGFYYNLSGSYDIGQFTVSAGIGYSDYDKKVGVDSYTDYSVGVSTEVAGLGLELKYTDTDVDNSNTADGRAIFTISKSM